MLNRLLVVLFILFFSSAHGRTEKVKLVTFNLPPYGSFAANSKATDIALDNFNGVAVDVVRCAFKTINQPVEISVRPWSRAQHSVQNGQFDGFFPASWRAQRDVFAILSSYIAEQKWVWYFLTNNSLQPNDNNFKEKALVASFNGSNMQFWLQQNNYKVAANPKSTKELYEMLKMNRLDAILANNLVMAELLKDDPLAPQLASQVVQDKPLGIYLHNRFLTKQNTSFLTELNMAIAACRN